MGGKYAIQSCFCQFCMGIISRYWICIVEGAKRHAFSRVRSEQESVAMDGVSDVRLQLLAKELEEGLRPKVYNAPALSLIHI